MQKLLGNETIEFHIKIESMWSDGTNEIFTEESANDSMSTDESEDNGDEEEEEPQSRKKKPV